MNAGPTRATLLARLRDAADQAAWHEFEAAYRGLILGYCRRRGLQPADAEDVLQSVLLGLMRALPAFEYRPEHGRFRGYLGRAVAHAIEKLRRRPAAAGLDAEHGGLAADDPSWEKAWEEEWVHHHYRRAMERLAADCTPASLAVFQDLLAGGTLATVAARHGRSPAAVEKIRQRLRERLRTWIAEQVQAEDEPDARGTAA